MISRVDALKALSAEKFDVVVVGGGITGAGVALDAASRGYTTALVERDDYAIGTSSRSSKMVHGGLRYLENLDIALVREALLERKLMVRLAPHLVYPTPFLVPTPKGGRRNLPLGMGLNLYDVMASGPGSGSRKRRRRDRPSFEATDDWNAYWAPDRHRTISGEEAVELMPALAAVGPDSAYMFYDCQTDDVRLTLTALGEAERYGAVLCNGVEVTEVLVEGGRVAGIRCREGETGDTFEIQATHVVNATGVFADGLRAPDARPADVPVIAPSRGTHILLPDDKLPMGRAAAVIPAGSGRRIFSLPWYGRTLVGTTDNDYDGEIRSVRPAADDVEYLLGALNDFFGTELGVGDIVGAYAGVRPLISTGDPKKSVDISRRAELYETPSGMLTITGGKLTTWRRMAKEVVDRLVERDGMEAPCRTADIPIGMPVGPGELDDFAEHEPRTLFQLAFRYGHAARNVLSLAQERPELEGRITESRRDLLAEVVVATRLEQARTVADVLLRRTRLGLTAATSLRTVESVMPVAKLMGEELGWDPARVNAEAEAWLEAAVSEGIDPANDRSDA